jgi:hypothetical protein
MPSGITLYLQNPMRRSGCSPAVAISSARVKAFRVYHNNAKISMPHNVLVHCRGGVVRISWISGPFFVDEWSFLVEYSSAES